MNAHDGSFPSPYPDDTDRRIRAADAGMISQRAGAQIIHCGAWLVSRNPRL